MLKFTASTLIIPYVVKQAKLEKQLKPLEKYYLR